MPRHAAPPLIDRPAANRAAATGRESRRSPAAPAPAWALDLHRWYAASGRHDLPWRRTRDRWAVLASEVMLQQTQVARVRPRWHAFLDRWPVPAALAAEPLPELLRFWQGLGYPRRARALHSIATTVAGAGWPGDEAGLRALPGVGEYTARALRCFCDGAAAPLPLDVNVRRAVARITTARGTATPRALQPALDASIPPGVEPRDHVYALFDLGATVCTARAPRCDGCPVRDRCAWRAGGAQPAAARRTQGPWATSLRRLRGAVLAALLQPDPPGGWDALAARVAHVPTAADPAALRASVTGLCSDGLLAPQAWMRS